MITQRTKYGVGTVVRLEYATAVERVKQALADEGFGILCEIDVAATMRKKLGVEYRPYVILGACNPPFAHRALTEERDIGLLLPCNVVVYAADEPGRSVIAALDAVAALGLTGKPDLRPVADEVNARLARALATVERGAFTHATA
ncbi:MAG TPA: DUF302 domain-containing protein [Gemmatimonadaceae bacterium]|nr:DUF302 domain-containing protein [Gemmatimonadaceae bacterium]